jgi:uncharacterized membrane protein YwaF
MENLYKIKHLLGLGWTGVLILFLIIVSIKAQKKYGEEFVLKIGAIFFLSLELIKYLYLHFNGGLSFFYFPIQFCSLMLYAYPIIAFGKGKLSELVLPFAYVGGLAAGLIALLMPTNILGDPNTRWLDWNNFIYTLSFVYHAFMIYYSAFLVISKKYRTKLSDIKYVVIIASFFALVAQILNIISDNDFMMLNRGTGNPLSFLMKYNYFYYIASQLVLLVIISFIFIGMGTFTNRKKQ